MEENTEKKLSYEELERLANDLYVRLQNADMTNIFKRLDYLFRVVENKSAFSKEFVENVVNEIETIMTIEKSEE